MLDSANDYRPKSNLYANESNHAEIESSFSYQFSNDRVDSIKNVVRVRQPSQPWRTESEESFTSDPEASVNEDAFTLAHYGITNDLGAQKYNWSLWIILGAISVGVISYLLRVRHKRSFD